MTRTALIALAALGLAGSAAAQSHNHGANAPAATNAPAPAVARPTITSSIKDLLANPQTQAVLEKHLPGIGAHPARPQFEDMTLAEVAPLSQGAITAEKIAAIDADLKKLPAA